MLENHAIEGLKFKGRHGYAEAARFSLWGPDFEGAMRVEVYSRRAGDSAPLALEGSSAVILEFAREVVRFAEAVELLCRDGTDAVTTARCVVDAGGPGRCIGA